MSAESWKIGNLKVPRPDYGVIEALYNDAIERIHNAESSDDVLEVLIEHDELMRRVNELISLTMIRHTMDTTDERYAEDQKWIDENRAQFTKLALDFSDALYSSPFKSQIEERIGHVYFDKVATRKKTFCEENVPLRQRERELVAEYQRIIDGCQKEVGGEYRAFWELQGLFSHEDRAVRKEAFKAFSEFLSENEDKLEEVWDELIKVRNEIGRNLGHENYVPVAYFERERIYYGREEIENFRKQVLEEIVPLCNKLFNAQAKRLGIDHVKAYDESAIFVDGYVNPMGDSEYMMNQLIGILRDMSPETEEFIDFMLEHDLIDYKPRMGKAATEYSTVLSSHKAPFIFTHFGGTASDVQLITESFGHSFAAYRSTRKQPLEDYFYSSSDIMEIHSMFMVQFVNKYADCLFGEDANKYVFGNLQNFITFIPFGVAVDEFQHICYDNPNLTPKERTLEWRKMEEKYMPWREYDEEDEFMNRGGYWYHKIHFFAHPFYYIEYSLATVNAMEMYRKYVERPISAWKEFLELTDIGGSKDCMEILRRAKLPPAFDDGAVKDSIGYVKSILEDYISA